MGALQSRSSGRSGDIRAAARRYDATGDTRFLDRGNFVICLVVIGDDAVQTTPDAAWRFSSFASMALVRTRFGVRCPGECWSYRLPESV